MVNIPNMTESSCSRMYQYALGSSHCAFDSVHLLRDVDALALTLRHGDDVLKMPAGAV